MGSMKLPNEHSVWDRHSIKAAIARKGKSLSELAREIDMPETTLRTALDKPCLSGEKAIANFLGIPLHILFPTRWDENGKRIYPRTQKRGS